MVIVDLLPGAARSSERPVAPSVPSARTGQHRRFGRPVFDWPSHVRYFVDRDGDAVRIRFDRAAVVDVAALRRRLPKQIGDVSVRITQKGLEVRLDPVATARVRHFRDLPRVVVDVLAAPAKPGQKGFRPLIGVDVAKRSNAPSVRFNRRERVSAAVYRRSGRANSRPSRHSSRASETSSRRRNSAH